MDFTGLEYIKNVNADRGWAYDCYPVGAYFQLNFKQGKGVDAHALKLLKGSKILLSQRPRGEDKRYLTHVVELVNEGSEDRPQWEEAGVWRIFRWVKVHWIADFGDLSRIPLDKNVMKTDWGWENTKAKRLDSPNLMSQWGNIESLRERLEKELAKIRKQGSSA